MSFVRWLQSEGLDLRRAEDSSTPHAGRIKAALLAQFREVRWGLSVRQRGGFIEEEGLFGGGALSKKGDWSKRVFVEEGVRQSGGGRKRMFFRRGGG